MTKIPAHVRAHIVALGALSRPLGEERAERLALELAQSVVNEIGTAGDVERALYAHETRIRQEIAAKRCRATRARGGPDAIFLRDVLPEFPLAAPLYGV